MPPRTTPRTRYPAIVAAVLSTVATAQANAELTPASWITPVSGLWLDASKWSTAPVFPLNSASATYDVTIAATGASYTVSLGQSGTNVDPVVVNALTLDSPDATLAVNTSTLHSLAPLQINAGRLVLANTVSGRPATITGTIAAGTGGSFEAYSGMIDSLTLRRRLTVLDDGQGPTVRNGLTLDNGAIALRKQNAFTRTYLNFTGNQTLAGTGEILFEAGGPSDVTLAPSAGTLTLSQGITVRSAGGDGSISLSAGSLLNAGGTIRAQGAGRTLLIAAADTGPNTLQNLGLIEATSGATLSITGQFSNAGGTIRANAGTVYLGGGANGGTGPTYTTAAIGTLQSLAGGRIVLGGSLDNSAATLLASDSTGDISLGNITVTGGTIATSGNATVRTNSDLNASLENVTLAGRLSGNATVRNTLTLDNADIAVGTIGILGTGSPTITGTGQVRFTAPGATVRHRDTGTLTLGPGLTLLTAGASGSIGESTPGRNVTSAATVRSETPAQSLTLSNFSNHGHISVANGGALTVNGTFTNHGTLSVTNAGVLTLRDNWSSSVGTISMADAQVNFAGTFTPAALANFSRSSGAVYLDGTLDLTGTSFAMNAVNGSWKMANGSTIRGGTLTASDGHNLTVVGNARLDGVTVAAPVVVHDSVLTLDNNASIAPGGSISLAGVNPSIYTRIHLNSPTLGGTGEIVFDTPTAGRSSVSSNLFNAPSITIGPNITIRTGIGGGGIGGSHPVVNHGNVSARTAGQSILIGGTYLTNTATMEAVAGGTLTVEGSESAVNLGTLAAASGGTLNLNGRWTNSGTITADNATVNLGGTFTPASIGNVTLTNNAAIRITGTLNLNSSSLTLSPSLPLALGSAGHISGTGTISSSDATPLTAVATNTRVTGATFNAPVLIGPGASITFTSATLNQPVTVTGGTLVLTGVWANNASITATANATVSLAGGTPPASLGNFALTDSTLRLSGTTFTTAQLSPMSFASSTLRVSGTLDNTDATLALSPATATLVLAAGTVKGGTISGPAGVPVVSSSVDVTGTLSAVTLAADAVVIPGSSLSFNNNLTLDDADISISPGVISPVNPAFASAGLISTATQTLGGTGTVTFDGAGGTAMVRPVAGTLTVGPNITIRTGSNSGFVGLTLGLQFPLVLQGTVSAQTPGKSISISGSTVDNHGTLQAVNSSSLVISTPSFTNTGTISISPNSTLLLSGGAANADLGTLHLAGTALLNYASTSPLPTLLPQLSLGRAGQTGIIPPNLDTNPSSAIAYVEAAQLLNLTGSQTATYANQTVDATTLILLPTLQGDANLNGTIDADDYALLDRSLALNLTSATWTQGDFNYDSIINDQDYLLIDRAYLLTKAQGWQSLGSSFLAMRESQFGPTYVSTLLTSIPEPSPLLSTLCFLLSSPLLPRRRRY